MPEVARAVTWARWTVALGALLAFGVAGAEPNFGPAEARPVVLNLLNSDEVAIEWPDSKVGDLPTGAGRLLLNLTLLAVECLPRGGSVRITLGANCMTIEAAGPQVRLSGEIKAAIAGNVAPAQLSARTVVGYYVTQLIASLGGRLDLADEGAGTIRFQTVFNASRSA